MQRKYGEFITVRKPIELLSSNFIYLERKFLGGSGYLVICQDHSKFKEELKTETVNLMGRKWIKVCKDNHQMTLTQIHEMVDELYYNDNKYSSIDHEEYSQQGFNQLSNVSKIQKGSLVQKQPRVSLPKWNTNHLQGEGKIVLISFVSVVQNTNIIPKYNWLTACHYYFGLMVYTYIRNKRSERKKSYEQWYVMFLITIHNKHDFLYLYVC